MKKVKDKLEKRMKKAKIAALKRASERRANSFFIVIIFIGIFVCIIITEIFYVEEEEWQEEKFLSMFSAWDMSTENPPTDILAPRMARELARVFPEDDDSSASASAASSNHSKNEDSKDYWQEVANTKDKFFVFSAYYDDRRTTYVRVIAAARTRLADKVVCRFHFGRDHEPVMVLGVNRLIRENWNLKYSAYFILCPLRKQPQQPALPVPQEVSIVRQGDEEAASSNLLPVHVHRKLYRNGPERGLAVCVKPLHYEYNKVTDIIEFIELNRLLGVDHFLLYNHTIGYEAGCILRQYVDEGTLTVLPWQLDMVSQKEIRTEGLFAAINDCLYRTMYRFRYVLMIDLDEYIIPQKNASLKALLRTLARKNPDRTGAFSFQNAFFYLQWPDDRSPASVPNPYKLLTLRKTTRKSKLHAHKQRSKCIVMPERVVEMGNHFVWEFVAGKAMVNVPPDLAFLHHYRVCEFGGNDCINTTNVVDHRTYTWKDALLNAVARRLRLLKATCPTVPQIVEKL